jgi:hypothetical protein
MEQVNAQEELAFIRKMMADTQIKMADDGKPSIVWGVIVALGMLATYISALYDTDFGVAWMWIGLSLLGWGYVYYYRSRKMQKARLQTMAGRIVGSIWGACGVCIGLVITLTFVAPAVSGVYIVNPVALTSIVSILLGMAYFLCGIVYGKAWVRYVAFGWWLGAIGMFLFPSVHVLGIYALMIIVFQVIPGIVLYRASKPAVAEGTATS